MQVSAKKALHQQRVDKETHHFVAIVVTLSTPESTGST
jgi:hypothetical protein